MKRLKLLTEHKGVQTFNYDEASIVLEEIEKLHTILNKLESVLKREREAPRPRDDYNYGVGNTLDYIWYKLQELKKESE